MVGRMLTCHGEATVKNCTVGDNVTIGKGVKLSNCLVMSHVTIEEACSLSNSVRNMLIFSFGFASNIPNQHFSCFLDNMLTCQSWCSLCPQRFSGW